MMVLRLMVAVCHFLQSVWLMDQHSSYLLRIITRQLFFSAIFKGMEKPDSLSELNFLARVRGSVPGLGGLKETKNVSSPSTCESRIVGSLRDLEVACSASDRQGPNFESCVWRTVSSQSSHHPQGVLLAQFSLYGHKGDLKPDSFHVIFIRANTKNI